MPQSRGQNVTLTNYQITRCQNDGKTVRIANNQSHIRTKHLFKTSPDSYDFDKDAASISPKYNIQHKMHTGLFEIIVGVLTTCHTQYT